MLIVVQQHSPYSKLGHRLLRLNRDSQHAQWLGITRGMYGDCAQGQRSMWYHQIRETCFHSVLFVSVEEQRLCVGRIGSVSEGGCRTSVNPSPSTPNGLWSLRESDSLRVYSIESPVKISLLFAHVGG